MYIRLDSTAEEFITERNLVNLLEKDYKFNELKNNIFLVEDRGFKYLLLHNKVFRIKGKKSVDNLLQDSFIIKKIHDKIIKILDNE